MNPRSIGNNFAAISLQSVSSMEAAPEGNGGNQPSSAAISLSHLLPEHLSDVDHLPSSLGAFDLKPDTSA